jgi:hypothetical protein
MTRKRRTTPAPPNGTSLARLEALLNLLDKLAAKERGVDVLPHGSPSLLEPDISLSIVLVGRPEMVKRGAGPYISYIKRALREEVDTLYLLAQGRRNVDVATRVCESLARGGAVRETLRLEAEVHTDGRTAPSILICLEPPEASGLSQSAQGVTPTPPHA